jgi:superfamily II DNA or RNA helicase
MELITVYPTKIVLGNYEENSSPKLEKGLSVWDKTLFRYSFSAFLYDDETRDLIIPGGFDFGYLTKLFPRDQYVNKKQEVNPYNKVKFSLKYPARDMIQTEAIKFLTDTKNPQKFLCLPTGKGKTYCSIHYVFKSMKLPIVLVDQENLMEQWKKSILHFTSVKEEEIFLISGKDSILKLMKMTKKELSKYKWFIAIHRTLNNYLENNYEDIDKLFNHLGIGVKLYDEAHVEFKNIFLIDSLTNTESIYITATPSRSDPIEDNVYQKIFKDVPMFKLDDDVLERYHNVIIAKYNSKPSLDDQAKMKGKYGFDVNKWCSYILQDGKYEDFANNIIAVYNKINKNRDKKTALLFHTMEGNGILQEDLKNEFSNIQIGRFDSSIKNKDKRLKEWEKDLVITTDASFGKAIDVKDLMIVIDTVPFGSKVMTEQMLGRLREIKGKEVFYVSFIDVGFESCRNQLKQRKNIYNKKAKNIYELDLE